MPVPAPSYYRHIPEPRIEFIRIWITNVKANGIRCFPAASFPSA